MFGTPITSWEDLVKEFAQDLDASNAGAWPYVDLTAQGTGVHVDSAYGDTSCEEDIEGHELVEIEPKGSRGAYVIMERFARSRSDGQSWMRRWLRSGKAASITHRSWIRTMAVRCISVMRRTIDTRPYPAHG